jgi:DNA processing protein
MIDACFDCLRRTDLLAALSGHIEQEWRLRRGRPQLLALPDAALLEWAREPAAEARYAAFGADLAVDRLVAGGIAAVCRCSASYPEGLHELPDPPAVLHVLGDPAVLAEDAVGLVGARRPSAYGLEVARSLARGLAAAGVPVVSGMAMGIDSAAHAGALEGGGRTVAVLATGVDRPYPARSRTLHGRIAASGCVVSELPPGSEPRRWAFPARNRLIAALSAGTVVVEGGERSGSLISADFAAELGRFVGAVPGAVTARMAGGPHLLLKSGAELIRDAADVLDLLHGAGGIAVPEARMVIGSGDRPPPRPAAAGAPVPADLDPRLVAMLGEIERGRGSLAELATGAPSAFEVARDLGELELRGLVTRVFGGRYIRAAR